MKHSKKEVKSKQVHNIAPVFNEKSRYLILGSFPSVKSRDAGFYYGHPQNRFWRVLAEVFNTPVPTTIMEKKEFLLFNSIALWDVIAKCEISGSADSSIDKVKPNDLSIIFKVADIKKVIANGNTAGCLYRKHMEIDSMPSLTVLPSTSPANASWSLERLVSVWKACLMS